MPNYQLAEELNAVLRSYEVRYLFIGKLGAILLGFPDTTEDVDLFIDRSPGNGRALVGALRELRFALTGEQATKIEGGDDLVHLHDGPFDLDLIFAPRGLRDFASSWERHVEVKGLPICHPDELIAIKEAMNRKKDQESLPRMRAFRDRWMSMNKGGGV